MCYVYPEMAQSIGVKDGSYLSLKKGDVHLVMRVCVLVPEHELLRAQREGFKDKIEKHIREAAHNISVAGSAKKLLHIEDNDKVDVRIYSPREIAAASLVLEIDFVSHAKPNPHKTLPYDELAEAVHESYDGQIFCSGQNWYTLFNGSHYNLTVKSFEFLHEVFQTAASDETTHTLLLYDTKLTIESADGITIKGARNPISFDFNNLGIGGLGTEFKEIFRRTFATRLFPPKVIQSLGINHVRGMLLYGPPGCGKTLMARKIGEMLNGPEPKIVNGPEILNKFVGQSEENIRNLFAEAEADYKTNGDKAELHVIIFDEIDAICKQRTGSSSPGSHDSIVNQLLSKIDGVNSINNILLIGMTNRKELLDDALLRPGRLEVHIEIPLPTQEGRLEILKIHMGKAIEQGLIAPDVELQVLAEKTKNYTGAEIEGVCKNAAQYALVERNLETADGKTPTVKDLKNIRVEMEDYERAISQSLPAFGANTESLSRFEGGEKIDFGPRYQKLKTTGKAFVDSVKESDNAELLSILFSGPPGSGKTALAATLAAESDFPFIKCISPEDLVGMHESVKMAKITRVFDEAARSPLSIVILDELERLVEFVPLGPRFSNMLLQTLQVLIKRKPRPGHRLIVMGTTSQSDLLHDLDLLQGFNTEVSVPFLNQSEILTTMSRFGVDDSTLGRLQPTITAEIGIKKLLLMLELAKMGGGGVVTYESFLSAGVDCGYDFI
jgi:vesicle-fusing ATPase